MLLSYIIPFYNAGASIVACLDSIYSDGSAEDDYEVIVVDDGSKDDGAEVVEKYAERHSNLRLIRQKNGGASAARNHGLDEAHGEWIRFVDADDRVVPFKKPITQVLKECKEKNNLNKDKDEDNVDLLTFNYVLVNNDGEIVNDNYKLAETLTGLDVLRHQRMYLWDKIFSRKLIGNNRFVTGTANQEDMFFCIQTLPGAKRVATIPERGYIYDCRSTTSTTRTTTPRQYVRNYQDSVVIQGAIKRIVDGMSDGEARSVIENILHEAVINHFYIILRFYSYRRVLRAMRDYGRIGLYPLGYCQNRQKNFFARLANHPWLLRLMAKIRWGRLF